MSGKVFANGLEIACKVSKGKSVAAFPDPCWSPPSPPAGPVVIPYANTAYAKDVTNASKSVLIKDKPIAQKDKSFFKTSTGNEAATKAFGQGVLSKTIKGKAYFTSWSMNVMVEGYNVARHTDLTTHNHGSNPGNSPPWPFVAGADGEGGACKDSIDEANKQCKSEDKKEELKKRQEKYHQALEDNKEKIEKIHTEMNKEIAAKRRAYTQELKKVADELGTSLKSLKKLSPKEFSNKYPDFTPSKELFSSPPKKLSKNLASDLIEHAKRDKTWKDQHCEDLFFLPSSSSIGSQKSKLEFEGKVIEALKEPLGKETFNSKQSEIQNRIATANSLSEQYKAGDKNLNEYTKEVTKKAKDNKCLEARKCLFVPYNHAKKTGINDELLGEEKGCCPGQTGHHIFPDAWGKSASCEKYTSGSAPTVCVEGTGRHHGSHEKIHTEMDFLVRIFKDNQKNAISISAGENGKNEDTAIAMAADSFHNSIGKHCDRKCTVAQLKHYYENQAECSGDIRPTEGHESGKGNGKDNGDEK